MDGRDFGPPRSVHGPPPPLLSGLAMDSHRVGAATAGRLPASGLPGALPPGKYMAGLNLHPHPGKCLARCPPSVVSSGSWEGGPGKVLGPSPPHPRRSQRGFGPSFSLGRSTGCPWVAGRLSSRAGETPGPGAEASLEAPVERGARLSCLPRRFGPSQGARVCRNRSHQGLFQTPGSCNSSLGWSFQNLGEKRTDQLHTL